MSRRSQINSDRGESQLFHSEYEIEDFYDFEMDGNDQELENLLKEVANIKLSNLV